MRCNRGTGEVQERCRFEIQCRGWDAGVWGGGTGQGQWVGSGTKSCGTSLQDYSATYAHARPLQPHPRLPALTHTGSLYASFFAEQEPPAACTSTVGSRPSRPTKQ